MNNSINIGFSNNPELASALSEIGVGQTAKGEVEFRIIAKDDAGMQGEVVSFVPEGFEISESEETPNQLPDTSLPSPATALPPVA
jgi:hypothetical protein